MLEIASWSLYDFADTIFSMNVVTMYFALWIVNDCGAKDIVYSLVYSASIALVAIFSPIFGVVADRSKNVNYYLALITTTSCVATFMIGFFKSLIPGLIFFLFANFAYQSALVFYNYLLPSISNEKNIGKISGIGVAFGYIGAIVGLLMIKPFVMSESFDKLPDVIKPLVALLQVAPFHCESNIRINAFIPTALLFFLFAIPCFIFVKPKRNPKKYIEDEKPPSVFKELLSTLKSAKNHKNIFLFLIANLIFMDAVHTVITFMSVFASKAIGFSDSEIITLSIVSTTAAIIGSFLCGILSDYIGHKKTLVLILCCWLIVIALAGFTHTKSLFYMIGSLCGIALGGVWVTTRPIVIQLSPEGKTGEFLGLYGLTGKCAAIFGPLLWGFITYTFDSYGSMKYRIAVLSMSVFIIIGLILLKKVKVEKKAAV